MKLLFLFAFAFLTTADLLGQELVEADLMGSEGTFKEYPLRQRDRIRFKIKNINRRIYSVTFNSETRSFYTTQPSVFDLIAKIDISKIQGQTAQDPKFGKCQRFDVLQEKVDPRDQVLIAEYSNAACQLTPNGNIRRFKRAFEKVKSVVGFGKVLELLANNACLPFDSLQDLKIRLAKQLIEFDSTQEIQNEFELLLLIEKSYIELIEELEEVYAEVNRDQEIIERDFPQVTLVKDKIVTGKSLQARKLIDDEFAKESVKHDNLLTVLGQLKIAFLEIQNLKNQTFLESLRKEYNYISLPNFEYTSPLVKAEKDQLKVVLGVTSKNPTDCNALVDKLNGVYEYDVYGFKVDYSVGVFLNMGTNIFDQTYRLDTIPGDQLHNQIRKNENKNVVAPTLGALMHFYWTSKSKEGKLTNGKGFNFGLSLSNQSKVNYHFGISYLFLGSNRIVMNAGAVMTQVQLISDQYKEGDLVDKSLTTIPLQEFYRIGGFFGLTWNIGRN